MTWNPPLANYLEMLRKAFYFFANMTWTCDGLKPGWEKRGISEVPGAMEAFVTHFGIFSTILNSTVIYAD
jgi:hypothetical protein